VKIIKDIEQGSLEWQTIRSGKVTASGMKNILTPAFKPRTGEMPHTYMMQILAEQWIGGALPQVQGVWDMEQGQLLETEARPFFALTTGYNVTTAAFIESDNPLVGASPDGIVNDCEGLELKCPHLVTHLKYLDAGELPDEYVLQVHGSLYVSGFKRWHFMSYRRNFPPLLLVVERDEEIMSKIHEAVTAFLAKLDAAMDKLIDLNGGLPNQKHRGCVPLPKRFVDRATVANCDIH